MVKPRYKTYWGYELEAELVDIKKISDKVRLLPTEERAMAHELSKEPIEQIVVLRNAKKSLGRLTTSQVKEILDDLGFNVDVLLSQSHFSDFSAVMNIGGSVIPGWVWLVRNIARIFPSSEKMLLLKLSPGKDRLHIRVFEMNDGSWMIAAHTDHNWMSLNLKKVYSSHLANKGAGDYITGTLMMLYLLREFARHVRRNKIFLREEIERTVERAYNESLIRKLGINLNISPVLSF